MSPPNDTDDADDADNDTEAKKSETESVRTPERNGNGPTKRKKSLTDTPTIPVVTNSLSQYDAVLAEAQDFIQAAAEAQNLGRLSISASYLALSHSRLIGLAKRFDLAAPSASKNEPPVLDDQLKALLPADVEWDQAMMAHLASAAAEYHAARTQPADGGTRTTTTTTASTPRQATTTTATSPASNSCDVRSVLQGKSLFDQEEEKGNEDAGSKSETDSQQVEI